MKKAALHNLGCKVNAYETEAMQQLLEANGYEIVPFSEKADVYIVNTCSVTNIADKKSRQMIHRARRRNPEGIVVAAGCYVQTASEQVRAELSADLLIGNNQKHKLISLLEEYKARREFPETQARQEIPEECRALREIRTDFGERTEYEELSLSRTAGHTRAFIKVQDGCNQFCSYCIIPYVRGRVRSRRPEDVADEVRRLAENGYREVVLTGIHLSSYGIDLGTSLLELIKAVHETEGIERIRLGSLEPRIITEEFARELASLPKVCPHFHLSLQSGCDATLKRMNRRYTAEEYAEKCGLLRRYFDDPALTTDVIVGFPGETKEEFETTRAFLEDLKLYETHIFKYSRRKGTRADAMPDQVSDEEKGERSAVLLALNEKNREAFENRRAGREDQVLFEEYVSLDGRDYYVGHTREYVKLAVLAEENYANQILSVRVGEERRQGILVCRRQF